MPPRQRSKRRRLSDSTSTPILDPTLYFDDGNIILSADNDDNDAVFFRLHKSILARESSVFKDMFLLPGSGATGKDSFQGVPVVVMHDKAEALAGFLKAIYEPHTIFLSPYHKDSARLLLSPLLLSKKYQADELHSRIVAHIKSDWPAHDYDEWKLRHDKIQDRANKNSLTEEFYIKSPPPPEDLIHLARATNLEAELEQQLHLAYYMLSS